MLPGPRRPWLGLALALVGAAATLTWVWVVRFSQHPWEGGNMLLAAASLLGSVLVSLDWLLGAWASEAPWDDEVERGLLVAVSALALSTGLPLGMLSIVFFLFG